MPPLLSQDPLDALHLALQSRWLDVPMTVLAVACEPWALVLVALALYAWLEGEVLAVLKVVAPLAIALVVAGGLAVAAHHAGAAPRPAWAGEGAVGVLRRLLPGGQTVAVATFAAYSLLAYGRRAAGVLGLLALGGIARAYAGPHWAADVLAGGLAGGVLGWTAHAVAVRLHPDGHLASLRAARRASRSSAGAKLEPREP